MSQQNVFSFCIFICMKPAQSYHFTNWGKNLRIRADAYIQPATEAELIAAVRNHAHIRVVGTGHSWSDVFSTKGVLLNLDKYQRVLHLDKGNKTLTVQAGIKLWQLNEYLDKQGFALINLGSIAQQSIAGAISTGTHGSGIRFQCLASQVLSFSLIDAKGEKRVLHKGTDEFNAAVISLGCLGVISEITLQITEAYRLHDKTYIEDFDSVIHRIDELIAQNDHFKLWWMPPAREVVVYTYKRTQEPRNDSRLRQFMNDRVLSVLGYRTMVKIGNLKNSWRPAINQFLTNQLKKPIDRIEKSFKVFNVPEPPVHRETEWAFDVKDAKELLRGYKELLGNNKYTFNFIQEIRFTKGDDFWLSECHGRDSIWIGVYNHEDHQWNDLHAYFEAFAVKWNGRPHWGKEFLVRKDYLQTSYPKYNDFIRLRKAMDPDGKFSNPLMEAIFD